MAERVAVMTFRLKSVMDSMHRIAAIVTIIGNKATRAALTFLMVPKSMIKIKIRR